MSPCILCPVYHPDGEPRAPHDPPACNGCRERLDRDLVTIRDRWPGVHGALAPGGGTHEHVSGTRAAPLPVRLDALSLLGPGAAWTTLGEHRQDQAGVVPPLVLLDTWCRDWLSTCDRRDQLPAVGVVAMVEWLRLGLDVAIEEHPAIDEFATDMARLARAIKSVVDDGRVGENAGRCPTVLRDETRCHSRLTVDPYVDQIQCPRCGVTWKRRDGGWVRLRSQQRAWDGEGEAA